MFKWLYCKDLALSRTRSIYQDKIKKNFWNGGLFFVLLPVWYVGVEGRQPKWNQQKPSRHLESELERAQGMGQRKLHGSEESDLMDFLSLASDWHSMSAQSDTWPKACWPLVHTAEWKRFVPKEMVCIWTAVGEFVSVACYYASGRGIPPDTP